MMNNLDKIAQIFPECITESRDDDGNLTRAVDFDILKEILGEYVSDNPERYQFTWVGKSRARLAAQSPTDKTLRPCPAESLNWDSTENLYIEGDNLDVLKILLESYLHKVKMIYIDPPYNTGNDFIYKDDFTMDEDDYNKQINLFDDDGNRNFKQNNSSNPRFHSDWCSMIFSRLLLAKHFLADDGVIFISIDDNEQANLKKICDEVFGEKNFVAQIIVIANPSGRDYGGIARMHEYILVYRKSDFLNINLIKDEDSEFNLFDEFGGFELRELRNRNVRFNNENRPNLYYPFYVDTKSKDENGLNFISLTPKDGWLVLYPMESQGIKTVWRWGKEKAAENLNINIMAKQKKNGDYMIVEKYRESKKMVRSIWTETEFRNENGTLTIKEIFQGKTFDYPKSVDTLKRLLEMATDKDAVVMDFFSGSATTAHAVMQLNAEDGGRRKFIMVQLPEVCAANSEAAKAGYKNICEIGKERIRRAGQKILAEKGLFSENLDVGFRVFKPDSSNMKDVYRTAAELTQEMLTEFVTNIKEDRTALDLLFGYLLKCGVEINKAYTSEQVDGFTIHNYNDGELIACFEENVSRKVIEYIADKKPVRAVFRDSSFATSPDKINANEIFKYRSPDTRFKVV